MAKINSKRKGKNGELEIANLLKMHIVAPSIVEIPAPLPMWKAFLVFT